MKYSFSADCCLCKGHSLGDTKKPLSYWEESERGRVNQANESRTKQIVFPKTRGMSLNFDTLF